MASPKTTLTSLPPELFLTIFSYLPCRTIKTVVSPLNSTNRTSPSKFALQNLSLTSKSLRTTSTPYIFESIIIRSFTQLEEFVKDGGIGEIVGRYVRRVVMRWDAYGGVMKLSQQHLPTKDLGVLMKRASALMSNLNTLTMDFPGAIDALAYDIASEGALKHLQGVSVRNGRAEYGGDVAGLLYNLGKLRELQTLIIDGTTCPTDTLKPKSMLHLVPGDFKKLVNLEVVNVSSFNDNLLSSVMRAASKSTALTIKNCTGVTLSGTKKLLLEYGGRLQCLSLEVLKGWVHDTTRAEHEVEHEHELYRLSEDEHLCPVIRDCCRNLQILDIYTNKICGEILSSKSTGSGAMTSGLPTPPESPDLPPTRIIDIPTPPTDIITDQRGFIRTPMLPPPLFSFQNLSLIHQGEEGEERLVKAPVEKRQKMKRVKLRIPYDSSCYGTGVGGPSLQQIFTTLCDGAPAIELLEVGKKAFEEGLVELVNVQGHWKGGPYLMMP
ncbi:hypothetical protein TWF106_000230 [Orbilia oligospora]|uniref:F-box domain-containing protein n=1 Tax=Orbilia oligospora TaxID=2813651 RepID=A0A6G1MMU4_ORBOL|nr:hypothetical protein TWF788_004132 [Orbilia oligospora]KAF3213333.1 hypothetical protein TWF191_010094 [Orbilia oligospora]KAF3221313.1 hypothetical protein TWF679_008006 [Orbilia oligospora]KAF3229612.1 hypothetical protein TWF106_000001 [Orbilia oligospora]KAF3229841.1 hypothetical protein TWF106_000230 [Orbilia oligospora]